MKYEDVPGYTELRNELYQARLDEKFAQDEKERLEAKKRILLLRRKLARALYEHSEEEKKRGK